MMSAKYITRLLTPAEFEHWDAFVENHPQGSVFQTSVFLLPLSESIHRRFQIVGIFQQQELLGGLAFASVQKFGKSFIPLPYDCPVFHPLFAERESPYISKKESYHNELADSLIQFLDAHFQGVKFSFSFSYSDLRTYKKNGFRADLNYTYLLDLDTFEEDTFPIAAATKRQINKAKKQQYTLSKEINPENITAFYTLIKETYTRQQLPLIYNQEHYASLFDVLHKKGWLNLFVIWFDGQPAAAMAITRFRQTAHYWLSASNSELMNMGGTSALIIEVIKQLKADGLKWFDFVGANTESIARFKAGFNFTLTPVYNCSKESKSLKLLFTLKKWLKK